MPFLREAANLVADALADHLALELGCRARSRSFGNSRAKVTRHGSTRPRREGNVRFTSKSDQAIAAKKSLFDHIVRLGEQRRRQLDAEGLGSFQVDCKVELYWLLYR
jgi:hypothetical protein